MQRAVFTHQLVVYYQHAANQIQTLRVCCPGRYCRSSCLTRPSFAVCLSRCTCTRTVFGGRPSSSLFPFSRFLLSQHIDSRLLFHSAPSAMAISSQTDEFDLLDSIFDELDAEALSKLDTVQTAAADSVDVHTKKAKTASQTLRRPSGPTAAAPAPRRALQPISSNGRQQQSQSQTHSGDVKGKGKASDTKPVASKSPSTSRTSGAFRPSSTKTQVAAPVSRLSSPAIRAVAQASRPSAHAPVLSTIQDSASQAARKQADAALLHDLDWSDDDQGVDLFPSTSKKGKEAITTKPAIKAKQGGVATKDDQQATAGHIKGPTAAEQSSRIKAEQLANARKQPGYVRSSTKSKTRADVLSNCPSRVRPTLYRYQSPRDSPDVQSSR